MPQPVRKVVFAPLGADTCGDDILLFEHGILFALEMAAEAAGLSFADVHEALGGNDKKDRPLPPLRDTEVRTLSAKAGCDAFIDGMLLTARNPEQGGLSEVAVAPRIFYPANDRSDAIDGGSADDHNTRVAGDRFDAPAALLFRAFAEDALPESLQLDFDLYIGFQYRVCEAVFDSLNIDLPPGFTADTLQVTTSWDAYELFLKGKRLTQIPEAKLGYYEQAIQRDPRFFLALYNCAMIYKTQTNYHDARNRLLRAASATTDEKLLTDVYFELGLCSIYLGDTKTARNFWEHALELGSDNPSLYVNMAGTYEQEEKWSEARRLNELALERFPDYHKAIVNLARLSAMFGEIDQAISLYERALALQPDDSLRRSILGGCYLAVGRSEDARREFEQAIELDPTGDPATYARQELEKLGAEDKKRKKLDDDMDETKKKKRWGLW